MIFYDINLSHLSKGEVSEDLHGAGSEPGEAHVRVCKEGCKQGSEEGCKQGSEEGYMLGEDMFDDKAIDLALIYEGLDVQIDNDILGKSANEKLKIKIYLSCLDRVHAW